MNNIDLQKILNEINHNKQQAINTALINTQKCMDNPDYSNIEYSIRELSFNIASLDVQNKDHKDLDKQLDELKSKQEEILQKLGFTRKDLEPQYKCQKCSDTGYHDGKLCDCVIKRYNSLIKENSSYSKLVDFKFNDFDPSIFQDETNKDRMIKLYNACKKFCLDFPNTNKNTLVFSGPTGVGKTYLVSAIANELIDKHQLVNYLTAFELNQLFLKYHVANIREKNSILENLINCDLLVIDDLGTEPILKNVTIEYLFLILNERSIRRKHTIISTNLSFMGMLDRYGERIFSRLADKRKSKFITIDNVDLRLT